MAKNKHNTNNILALLVIIIKSFVSSDGGGVH